MRGVQFAVDQANAKGGVHGNPIEVQFEDNQANFRKFFHADIEKWKNLVKSTHLKLE